MVINENFLSVIVQKNISGLAHVSYPASSNANERGIVDRFNLVQVQEVWGAGS
jgi:hypothetical protein